MWTVLSSSHLLQPVGYLSGRWREMYLMSVYMFLLLYCFNSLGDHSGRSPMYHGVKMYSNALFPFIASVQYFLKVFWMFESWVWVSGGGWLVGWLVFASLEKQFGGRVYTFQVYKRVVAVLFLPCFPCPFCRFMSKARNLSKRFLPYVGHAVSCSIDSDLELLLGDEELASDFPMCFPRCSCFLIT